MHDDHEKPVRIVGLNIGNGCAYDEKKRRSVTSIVDNVDRLSLTSVLNTYSIDKVFDQKKEIQSSKERQTVQWKDILIREKEIQIFQRLALSPRECVSVTNQSENKET